MMTDEVKRPAQQVTDATPEQPEPGTAAGDAARAARLERGKTLLSLAVIGVGLLVANRTRG
jgi:hypothetical protein